MFHPDLDKLADAMPPWAMRVTIGGVSYAVRQPTLAEDEQLAAIVKQRDSDGEVIRLIWSFFDGIAPPKSAATRDTLILLYTQLLLYRKARKESFERVAGEASRQVTRAVNATRRVSKGSQN